MRNPSERDDRAQLRHRRQGSPEKLAAGVDLDRQRLVLWRNAMHGIGDPAVDQLQAVVGPRLIGALGEAVFEQRGVEQVAGIVAGEGAAGAVGALHAWCKADDQQARLDVAEGGDRRVVPQRLARAVRLAKGDQARTKRTVTVGNEGERLAA
ncbi:hypothetical protein ACVWXN_002562 [Bradyrhizobium sp. i1.4.4]